MRIVELFSGIGSQAKALKNIGVDIDLVHTCEWDIHAIAVYDLINNGVGLHQEAIGLNKDQIIEKLRNYNLSLDGKESMKHTSLRSCREEVLRRIYSSILRTNNLVNIVDVKGEDIGDDIDLMTYSFPCQDLSNVGSFHGYNKGIDRNSGNRSSLLWQVERILEERKAQNLSLPKFLMLENVPSLLSKKHRPNFEEWKLNLRKLGYTNNHFRLIATDFGLPQTRYRLIMVSTLTQGDEVKEKLVNNYFDHHNLENKDYIKSLNIKQQKLQKLLRLNYNDEKIRVEALAMQPNDTLSRRKIWENNPQIIKDSSGRISLPNVATLTTKQDRHPNSGNIYFDYKGNTKSKFRYLTPRERLLLMGYDEKDYDILLENNLQSRKNCLFFYRDKLIRLAGNSIALPMLEQIFKEIISIKKIIDD